ncbi:translation elongation factor Ts (EF-Ts) [Herbinix hemicellulosilytica]|uniref:Elongation factor Ts n=1 Tax=Herbinix hemicellulosilytica TaxID=1564487 RepID=A0A0H5SHK5_HERHM|nr:translation elongation factor Ts [Herbinix hemicellulosilytica]RBP60835.1 translation elongation factor Ts (EF-Ts) [Herbinix hemicellulosilytica]CRZ34530.1 Elongation factor Ts [Herbinix hemicellulosilytica]
MNITANMVKELRDMTGAGMMECKKALTETGGDMDKAVEYLRERGLAAAEKKAGRIAAEGIVDTNVSEDGKVASIVEVNCETDFVAKNEKFKEYVAAVAAQAAKTNAANIDDFLAEKWELDPTKTVKEQLASMIAVIGENMNIRRFEKLTTDNGFITSYIHGGGRIGILVDVETTAVNDEAKEAAKNVAMQIAAMNPKYVKREDVPEDFIAHEKNIIKAQIMNDPANSKKPENIIEKMIEGRLNKELKEMCLVDQLYVKDSDMTVGQYLESVSKQVGAPITIKRFVRFETGEGLEKKSEDFAAEVAKQMGM